MSVCLPSTVGSESSVWESLDALSHSRREQQASMFFYCWTFCQITPFRWACLARRCPVRSKYQDLLKGFSTLKCSFVFPSRAVSGFWSKKFLFDCQVVDLLLFSAINSWISSFGDFFGWLCFLSPLSFFLLFCSTFLSFPHFSLLNWVTFWSLHS